MVLMFKAVWESIDDECRVKCYRIVSVENRHRVEKLILSNHRVTVTETEAATGLARYQINLFIHELGFQKVWVRCI